MSFRRLTRGILAATAMFAAVPMASAAFAQATVAPGMQVVDQAGNPVGTVVAVSGADLTVRTDRHDVQLPATSFTPNAGKLLFGMTREQLNTSTDQAIAAANASVAVGASVSDSAGQHAGTIEAVDDTTVTLKLASGDLIRLPRSGVAGTQDGAVLGVTIAELQAMAAEANGSE